MSWLYHNFSFNMLHHWRSKKRFPGCEAKKHSTCKCACLCEHACMWTSVWRAVCETREGWQLNSELTHDSTTSTHTVLYTAALTEPNSHFILIPLSFSFCAPLYCCPPSLHLHPSIISPSIHVSLLNLLSMSNISFSFSSICLYFNHTATLYPPLRLCTFLWNLSPLLCSKLLDFWHSLSPSTVRA